MVGTSGMLVVALTFVLPLYWIAITSLRPSEQILSAEQTLFVGDPTFGNYRELIAETAFLRSILNSLIVSVVVTVLGILVGALAGYAFAKRRFPGRDVLFVLVLVTLTVPALAQVIPNFVVMVELGLVNTLWAVILPQAAAPLGIFWMRQYIKVAVPDVLLDAGRVDGMGELRLFWSVVVPLIRPGMAGLAIWLFLQSWSEFVLPLAYLHSNDVATYPVFLDTLAGDPRQIPTHLLIAAAVLATLPIVVVFLAAQRQFVSGIASGAIRG